MKTRVTLLASTPVWVGEYNEYPAIIMGIPCKRIVPKIRSFNFKVESILVKDINDRPRSFEFFYS